MFCGWGSFVSRVDGDPCSPPATRRGSRRKHGSSRGNPYASRGIDKFNTVLADLQARREKVMMAREGGASTVVRFFYSGSSRDWIPIVVKAQPEEKPGKCSPGRAGGTQKKAPPDAAVAAAPNRAVPKPQGSTCRKVRGHFAGGWGWQYPYYYCWLAAVVALVLLCLVLGRSFAICCTSVGWYLLPYISGDRSPDERDSRKKDYRSGRGRRWPQLALAATVLP